MLKPINIVVAVLSVAVIFLGYMVLFQNSNGQPSVEEQREQRQRDIYQKNREPYIAPDNGSTWEPYIAPDNGSTWEPYIAPEEYRNCTLAGGTWDVVGVCTWPSNSSDGGLPGWEPYLAPR